MASAAVKTLVEMARALSNHPAFHHGHNFGHLVYLWLFTAEHGLLGVQGFVGAFLILCVLIGWLANVQVED